MNSFSSSALEGVSLSSNVLFLVCLGLLASTSMPAYSRLASPTGASPDEDEDDDEASVEEEDDDMITTDKKKSGEKKVEKKNRKKKKNDGIKQKNKEMKGMGESRDAVEMEDEAREEGGTLLDK